MSGDQPASAREIYLTHDDRLDANRREAWVTWLTRHGIDPDDVPAPNHIVALGGARTIFLNFFHREDGAPGSVHSAGDCPTGEMDHMLLDGEMAKDACVVRRPVQLEGRALPFPDFATPKEMMHP